ncbi:malonyl-ACP decarboxylase [Chitinophaga sp. CF118]|uniref:beta-ketoacyl synthase N-terminal-like domain-containing protein n=1 Tax=Chitinophaga sp. CF118 TaxID=1884367 RepID=UPI0008E6E268|nr:beta-ketoacyl synthase N-terminal-like domain-containing protein [Chitinophaga sp. CF118]SFD21638.1 malonyl-ACP decarboxylase [Chitinophaga sp. CF118]
MKEGNEVQVTGMGVITPVGIGVSRYTDALREGTTSFSIATFEQGNRLFRFPVAKGMENFSLDELNLDKTLIDKAKGLRHISGSASAGVYCALEAWADAGLADAGISPDRIAIVSAGSNTQQASLEVVRDKCREKLQFMNPNYGFNFFDTDCMSAISAILKISGEGHAISAASASGNMGIIQGCRLIGSGEYDIVLVVAPFMELSIYEWQGFTALGAMAVINEGQFPEQICRPFDTGHAGFVYGQSAGCLILESARHAADRQRKAYGTIAGYGANLDASRGPEPAAAGEEKAMKAALKSAGLTAAQIDYVNTHGTASLAGDKAEVAALLAVGLEGVSANSTKSLIGHALSAAGLVEAISCLIQMKEGFLHVNNNLTNPISSQINWVREKAVSADISYAVNNSFGFGGINTSIIIKR